MTEQNVVNAFLAGTRAESPPLRSDGVRLHAGGDLIAEWGGRLVIEPRRQGAASERCKQPLRQCIAARASLNREVRRLLHRSCRDELCSALRAHRPGGAAAPEELSSSANPAK